MANDWQFSKRNPQCGACDREFGQGEDVFSMLSFADQVLNRGDLCRSCFDARDQATDVAYWRTTQRDKRQALRLDFDSLLSLLEKLLTEKNEQRLDLCYLLSLFLVRRKKLRLIRVRVKAGKEIMILRKVRSQKLFEVESREMSEEKRSQISEQLADLVDPATESNMTE